MRIKLSFNEGLSLFELFDPGRHVRRYAVQLRRRLVDAALLDHGPENLECSEIHILNKRT